MYVNTKRVPISSLCPIILGDSVTELSIAMPRPACSFQLSGATEISVKGIPCLHERIISKSLMLLV